MKWRISTALGELMPTSSYRITDEDYSSINWMDSSNPLPSLDAINAKIIELDNAEPMRLLRLERNKRLALTDWRAVSDLTLSTAWKTYRQALRDLPASASPKLDADGYLDMSSVTFPTEPS